jgi:hypothetical protein
MSSASNKNIEGSHTLPKFYADANFKREKEYYDFENMKLKKGYLKIIF